MMQGLTRTLELKELGLLIGIVTVAVLLLFSLIFAGGIVVQTAGLQNIVAIAEAIEHGQPIPQAHWKGGIVPYVWGGGHSASPGPSLGTCDGYTGSIQPCPADHTVGVDCSGFARWVYSIAFGKDVLGSGATYEQIKLLHEVSASAAQPGDLVFYSHPGAYLHHVGIYIGHGEMINALKTGTVIRTDPLLPDLYGFYHYPETSDLLAASQTASFSVIGLPTINAAFIDQVLAAHHSPAQGTGAVFYADGLQYGIDPAFALAFFQHDSDFGTAGVARYTQSIGNIKCTGGNCYDGFQVYPGWAAGIQAWYSLIRNSYINQQHLFTVAQIIPVYAPGSDGNNVSANIADVQQSVTAWRSGNLNS
jgi:hypothetical protein